MTNIKKRYKNSYSVLCGYIRILKKKLEKTKIFQVKEFLDTDN